MPKVFDWNGYRFHFFANEGDPREPPHVHVRKDGAEAKFWLTPVVRRAWDRRFDARTLKIIETVVIERRQEFEEQWHVFFA